MNVSVFGNTADTVVKFTRKGALVGVIGRLTQRKYVRKTDNVEVTSTDVVATQVEFMEPKGKTQDASGYQPDAQAPAPENQAAASAKKEDSKNLDSIDVVDDDLPF
jgi:single stranded DNA-binding protein